uniref:Uncharacterized protein n=1 Tax=Oryza glumipatula TaxID=40148 RepID=A0A0D9ZY62_9ORYZ
MTQVGHHQPRFTLEWSSMPFDQRGMSVWLVHGGWKVGGGRWGEAGKEGGVAPVAAAVGGGSGGGDGGEGRMSASLLRHQVALPRLQLAVASTPAMKLPGRGGAHSPRCCTREADARISTEDGDEEDV